MPVHLFLNQAFDELLNKNFSIPPEEWQEFCDRQGITNDQLQEEKLRLEGELKAMVNPSNDEQEQKLKDIFCCDPFAPKSVEDLLAFWQINNRTLFEYLLSYYDIQLRSYINRIRSSASSNSNQTSQNNSQPNPNNQPSSTSANNPQPTQNSNNSFNLVRLLELILGVIGTPPQRLFQLLVYVWSLVGSRFSRSWRFYIFLFLVSVLASVFVFLIWTLTLDMPSIEAKAESAKNDLKSHEIKALENALDASFELKSLTGKFSWIPVLNSNPPLLYSPLESLQTNMAKIHEQDEIDISSKFSSVQAMSVSRDGTALAISQGDNEKKIQVWKQPTSTQLNEELGKTIIEKPSYELKNCDDNIFSLGVDSTGKRLVTGGSEGTVCLFLDIEAKKSESTVILTKTNQRINSVNFSQDDKLIAIAKADGQVVVVNLKGRVLNSFQPTEKGQNSNEEKPIFDVSFNQDNTKLVTAGRNGDIKLWRLENLDKSPKPEVSFLSDIPVKPLAISYLDCWNAYKELVGKTDISCKETKTSKGSNDGMPFLKTGFRKTGELLVITENKGILSVLQYSQDDKNHSVSKITLNGYGSKLNGNILNGAGFDFENDQLFTISHSLLQRWNLEKKPEYPIVVAKSKNNITKLSLRDNSKENESTVSLLTINENNVLEAWGLKGKKAPINEKDMIKQKLKPIKNISFISEEQFVTVSVDDAIWLWDLKPAPLTTVKNNNNIKDITSIATTSNNLNLVAVGSKNGLIDILDFSGSILKKPLYTSTDGEVGLINLSKDGKHLVSVVADKVWMWDISNPSTPSERQALNKDSTQLIGGITDIRFNDTEKDKHIALVTEKEKNIKFFNVSGEYDELSSNRLELDDSGINGVSFSQFNKLFPYLSLKQPLVAAVGIAGKVRVWDWQTKKLVAQFKSQLKTLNSIEISSDGTELFLGGGDNEGGKVEKWPIPNLDELITKGCDWLKDYHRHSSPSQSSPVKAKCAEQLNPKK